MGRSHQPAAAVSIARRRRWQAPQQPLLGHGEVAELRVQPQKGARQHALDARVYATTTAADVITVVGTGSGIDGKV